jgi:ferredoxin-NADP reductase
MSTYTLRLKFTQEVAAGTMAFHFEKPEGFLPVAGQYGDFTLINPKETDDEGVVRSFTLASAPFEDSLFITTRIRDTAFKRILKSLDSGSSVSMEGPFGELTLGDEDVPAVFLTGGIGITPVRSMVQQALFEKNPRKLIAFFSNRKPEDAPFLDELTRTAEKYETFTLIPTMTDIKPLETPWAGETGLISADLLKRHIDDVTQPIYYLSGPPALVASMRNLLSDLGVLDENIHAEDFLGY